MANYSGNNFPSAQPKFRLFRRPSGLGIITHWSEDDLDLLLFNL